MPTSTANATWTGGLKTGQGEFKLGTGLWSAPYSFKTRFEGAAGTNPEELIAAAHASCYAMALSGALEQAGFSPTAINTTAKVHIDNVSGGFAITEILLDVKANVPGISEAQFASLAEQTKVGCPVSKALASVKISLSAELL